MTLSPGFRQVIRDRFRGRLARRRDQLGLSDRQLAKLVGIDSTSISRYVRGATVPRLEEAAMLAKVLRTTVGWLMAEERGAPDGDDIDLLSYERGYEAAWRGIQEQLRRARRHSKAAPMIHAVGDSRKR